MISLPKTFLALMELLGEDDPETRQYRQELASILSSEINN